jgi:trehalose 6-phosphate phosphatase
MEGRTATTERILAAVEPLRADPDRAAILCDLDGTLAPIVERPEDVAVPDPTREALRAIASRYALVGVVSGRRAADARRRVGLDQLAYSGNHGFEMLLPGEDEPRPDPSLDGHEDDAPRFVAGLDHRELDKVGIRREDKGAIVALHWRGAPNEGEAESLASEVANEAEWQGLVPHRGRKVLEIRPNVPINKGIAVAALLAAGQVSAALYGGDDRTDLDAFVALRTLRDDGELEATVCVAVAAEEAPPEVAADADLLVDGVPGFARVLEILAAQH